MSKVYHAIGLMSGSSLDGLDVGYCRFEIGQPFQVLDWKLLKTDCLPFGPEWEKKLKGAAALSAPALAQLHTAFGHCLGQLLDDFFEKNGIQGTEIDLIASHGHTVFHEPAKGYTLQIGDGAALAAATGCKVVCDFRSSDVALGGQGAPLAPMADKMLFPGFDFYLNLGGIANITCNANGRFVAFDITGANQVLNALAQTLGYDFDENGHLASAGSLEETLFAQLNSLPFLALPYPKSLSNQWVQENPLKICQNSSANLHDKLYTTCRHVAFQLKNSIAQIIDREGIEKKNYSLLATGGGVFNGFLMECIRAEIGNVEVEIPALEHVKFKEACLMALLGVMRMEGIPNCISSVTGARKDAVGGAVYSGSL